MKASRNEVAFLAFDPKSVSSSEGQTAPPFHCLIRKQVFDSAAPTSESILLGLLHFSVSSSKRQTAGPFRGQKGKTPFILPAPVSS